MTSGNALNFNGLSETAKVGDHSVDPKSGMQVNAAVAFVSERRSRTHNC